jgi:peptidoglycan hydrolase-like protein with peptidoglycan-binding domain
MGRPRTPLHRVRFTVALLTVALASGSLAGGAYGSPLNGRSMWIWYVSRSGGGTIGGIAATAQAAGVKTLIIKSGDGSGYWSQFNRGLVRTLHGNGLRVCAWQFVYGNDPAGEAAIGARAVRNGADCLVIDAEGQYEGKYASARVYIDDLRAAIGYRYTLALAGLPYVDYHPGFPYSVFLGPGGAQVNMPQMYWRDIGSSIETVFHHTYTYNRIYRRAIIPMGQTYNGVSAAEVALFRGTTVRYGAPGISWWDYAWTDASGLWSAISGPYTSVSSVAPLGYPILGPGSQGDDVVWLQELLARVEPSQRVTGTFASLTLANLTGFQSRRGLAATGMTSAATWRALLRLAPVRVAWRAVDLPRARGARSARSARSAAAGGQPSAPLSAGLPAVAYEIPPGRARDPGR